VSVVTALQVHCKFPDDCPDAVETWPLDHSRIAVAFGNKMRRLFGARVRYEVWCDECEAFEEWTPCETCNRHVCEDSDFRVDEYGDRYHEDCAIMRPRAEHPEVANGTWWHR
jgi:hypothetical protein